MYLTILAIVEILKEKLIREFRVRKDIRKYLKKGGVWQDQSLNIKNLFELDDNSDDANGKLASDSIIEDRVPLIWNRLTYRQKQYVDFMLNYSPIPIKLFDGMDFGSWRRWIQVKRRWDRSTYEYLLGYNEDGEEEIELEDCFRIRDMYGVRKKNKAMYIGNSNIYFNKDEINVQDKVYPMTHGLLEFLFKKDPQDSVVTQNDKKYYLDIVERTNMYWKNYKPDTKLQLNKIYQITEIKKVNTKYGPKILGIVENEFSIFFPNRTNRMLIDDEEQLTSLIDLASAGELHLNYFGTAYHKFEFLIKPS
ncbi:Protein of unknown function [Cotesia congregata]|uniref:DUF8207 domain-containing protein n=1 Tax=Cotesia congregata TaxID=51543 RepID=A0A8J2MJ52_COTCN|nr:Protein of unknown function [Cotesia congregata]